MFNPKYRILLKKKDFPPDKAIGLGTQLISIITSIKDNLTSHIWYGADIEAVGKSVNKFDLDHSVLSVIGSDLELINYCKEIDQFIWGVFVCVDKKYISKKIQEIELETEESAFRPINANGILLEVRAFDTTYFAIYTEKLDLIKKISEEYSVEIEKKIDYIS